MIVRNDLTQRLAEIADQRAADAAGVHLVDADTRVLHEAAVDADLAEFVFDQNNLLALVGLADHFLNERGLARSKKTGINVNGCHNLPCFLSGHECPLYFLPDIIPLSSSLCKKNRAVQADSPKIAAIKRPEQAS